MPEKFLLFMEISGKHWMFAGKMVGLYCCRKLQIELVSFTHTCTHRRAIELVEGQERSQRLLSEKNSEPLKPLHVTLRHIASVMSEVYNPTAGNSAARNTIPLQQKLVMCALILMTRGKAKKEVNLGKLHEEYTKLCRQRRLKFESESEFIGLCNMLATSGIIALKKGKETRLTKVSILSRTNYKNLHFTFPYLSYHVFYYDR